eukprot:570337-Prymnesium_polylepis.1
MPNAHSAFVSSVAFSPDGTNIVSGSEFSIKLWGVLPCAQAALAESLRGGWCVVWAPTLACVCVADGSTLAPVVELPDAHSGDVHSVAFSPDGTKIVLGTSDNSIIVHAWMAALPSRISLSNTLFEHTSASGKEAVRSIGVFHLSEPLLIVQTPLRSSVVPSLPRGSCT